MDEGLKEFTKRIKKVSGPRVHKITNSYGVYDAYKYYRKHKPNDKKYVLTESQFFAIIRGIHNKMVEHLLKGGEIKFPLRMGGIELRKYKVEPRLDENGKLIYKAPIDWNATLKCWYEHEEAFKNKILIKVESRESYKIHYTKNRAQFINKTFFYYRANRTLKNRVSQAARENKLEAFTYRNYQE